MSVVLVRSWKSNKEIRNPEERYVDWKHQLLHREGRGQDIIDQRLKQLQGCSVEPALNVLGTVAIGHH